MVSPCVSWLFCVTTPRFGLFGERFSLLTTKVKRATNTDCSISIVIEGERVLWVHQDIGKTTGIAPPDYGQKG
jgi:hypothetical protein